ncbi:MAG TPA: multicopper oxidase domain-containing protein, partial [Actinomycetota bacterium]|nr:multicopper oxidase domain-containing protein [Actinomycetota bacterium]
MTTHDEHEPLAVAEAKLAAPASPTKPAAKGILSRLAGRRRRVTTLAADITVAVAFMAGAGFTGVFVHFQGTGSSTAAATSPSTAASQAAPAATVMVHLSDQLKIDPAETTVAAGGTITVMNTGVGQHNLAVKGTSLATPMINGGSSADLALTGLAPGTYTIYCQVPGHVAAGMTATLHIAAAATGANAAAHPTPAPSQSMTVAQMDELMARSVKAFPAKTAGLGGQVLAPTVLPDGTKEFDLTAAVTKWEVSPGQFVDAWTYNGTVPGPTLHVNPGDKVKVVLTNKLRESTSIHFHGIVTPNAMDGVPEITQPPVDPGQSFTYTWTAQSTPAVGMYHSHQDAVKQVPDGLAGAFLIGDEPVPAGVKVAQQQIMMLNDSGTVGLTINGKSFPATAPIAAHLGDWIEVQYLNEGQMIHPMHLHGMAQLVIAEDGYAVPAPYDVDTL